MTERNPSSRTAAVLTVSDSTASGLRTDDISGDTLEALLKDAGFVIVHRIAIPDERPIIASTLRQFSQTDRVHCIFTTGGTGIGPRDVTPEATREVIERELPGLAEAMRMESLKKTPFAMTSRQVAGVCGTSLIVNFPGSPKAVAECFAVIRPVLHHIVDLIGGRTEHGMGE